MIKALAIRPCLVGEMNVVKVVRVVVGVFVITRCLALQSPLLIICTQRLSKAGNLRDWKGTVQFIAAQTLKDQTDIVKVEGDAIKLGMELAGKEKLSKVTFASDNAEVIQALLTNSPSSKGGAWLQECKYMLESHLLWNMEHVLREANLVADALAQYTVGEGRQMVVGVFERYSFVFVLPSLC
ncbi:hypothetical protein QQ045_026883 [Rhodiola kirilowii]